MSDTTTNDNSWFLQGDDGTVYGPVDTATLKAWCLEGRIEPDNVLSQDLETWTDAADVAELEMDWLARLEDGTCCGPFHLQLVPGLIENGIIPANAMLENRHTGKLRPASGRTIADDLFPDWTPNPAPQARAPKAAPAEPAESEDPPYEARHDLQALRTAHTVLQDESQRVKDELAAATKARQKSEQQLLEQQDRAAAAETEVENLKAQLEQMKNHYERLQLENQSQFEKIDALQATQLQNEQRFKRELIAQNARADAKTELLAGTVQLLMRDSDLARRLKSLPVAAAAEDHTEPLRAAVRQLEQQLEHERQQSRLHQQQPAGYPRRHPLPVLLLFVAGLLLGAAVISLTPKGCARMHGNETPPPAPVMTNGSSVATGTTEEREFVLEAEPLDLQPEAGPLSEGPAEPPEEGTAQAIQWPALSLPTASIRPHGQSLRIVFNEGLFSVSTRLTPEAETALRSLAEQFEGKLTGYQLMIEGHTDATQIATGGSRYVDNFALGMARAEAVKAFLVQTGRIPAGAMRTSSAGDSSPPFSNETDTDRKRNRTAVLTLVRVAH
jgi:flagellar motor protein MotB